MFLLEEHYATGHREVWGEPKPQGWRGMGEAGVGRERAGETVFGDDDVVAGEFVGRSVPVATTLVYPGRLKEKGEKLPLDRFSDRSTGAYPGAHCNGAIARGSVHSRPHPNHSRCRRGRQLCHVFRIKLPVEDVNVL